MSASQMDAMLVAMTIHFICRGNVLRSLIAETYLKSLNIPGVTTLSSGAIADETRAANDDAGYMTDTKAVLTKHGLASYTKERADQLTQDRLSDNQLVVFANQIAYDEAAAIVQLPAAQIIWEITDIGEGDRIATTGAQRLIYTQEIYNEIIALVDELLQAQGFHLT